MTKALTKRVATLENELHQIWQHLGLMAKSQETTAREITALREEVQKVVGIIRIGLILLGATLLQTSGDPAAKELAGILKQVLGFLVR